MDANRARTAPARRITPVWLWAALLAGAVLTLWWAWFVAGFLHEPSAVGPVLMALLGSIILSIVAGITGAVGAIGLLRRKAWAWPLAWIAAVTLTLSGLGAIGGIPALIGLGWSPKASTP